MAGAREREANVRLVAARVARDLSQQELATALESHAWHEMTPPDRSFRCYIRKVQYWEGGTIPQPAARRVVTSFFGRTSAQLGFDRPYTPDATSTTVLAEHVRAGEQEDDVLRRRFVTAVPIVVAAPAALVGTGAVGMEDVRYIEDARAKLQSIDHEVGGFGLHPIAGRYLAQARALIERARPDSVGRALRSATGKLAASAGWFAHDSAEYPVARAYFNEALVQSKLADDAQLEACVYYCMMSLALRLRRPREALELACAGERLAGSAVTPRVRALFQIHQGRARAQLGDVAESERATGRAWETLGRARADDELVWASFADEAEMIGATAANDAELGAYARAARRFEESISQAGPFLRNRAARTSHLALVRLSLGDADGGCAAAVEAVDANVASTRLRQRLGEFAKRLTAYDTQAARDFLDRWHVYAHTPLGG